MTTAAPDDSWAYHPTTDLNLSFAETSATIPSQVFSPVSSTYFGHDISGAYIATTTSAPADSFNTPGTVFERHGFENENNNNTDNTDKMAQNQLHTFPLLFRTASEIPVFQVPYRWWEADARTVLWSFDVRQISLVIRFSLFHDSNKPRTALQRRDASFLDTFLASVLQPYELPFIPTLSQSQKVEEILRRSQATTSMNLPWSWYPSQALLIPEPAIIAQEIEAESQLLFKAVPFEAWVRCSLGFPAAEVDWFLLQHNALYVILWTHLQAHQHEVSLYRQVEKVFIARVNQV